MKPILTILSVIVFGTSALANSGKVTSDVHPQIEAYEQVTTLKMDSLLDSGIVIASYNNEVEFANKKRSARLYKFKNSRIKKALTFTTKRNKARMA